MKRSKKKWNKRKVKKSLLERKRKWKLRRRSMRRRERRRNHLAKKGRKNMNPKVIRRNIPGGRRKLSLRNIKRRARRKKKKKQGPRRPSVRPPVKRLRGRKAAAVARKVIVQTPVMMTALVTVTVQIVILRTQTLTARIVVLAAILLTAVRKNLMAKRQLLQPSPRAQVRRRSREEAGRVIRRQRNDRKA